MNKRIISLMAAALALLSASGQVVFTGYGEHAPIPIIPDKSETGLDMIYVVYNTEGVKMSYTSSTGQPVTWCSYANRDAWYGSTPDTIAVSTTLDEVLDNTGYIIYDGLDPFYCWVVNYADYELELNDIFINDDKPCALITFNIDGQGSPITFYPYKINSVPQVLSRELKLSYQTMKRENGADWEKVDTTETFESLNNIVIDPPLCNTSFMLTGDRFLEKWSQEGGVEVLELDYYNYSTQAVSCGSIAVQEKHSSNDGNESEDTDDEDVSDGTLGGSAPAHIVFTGFPTEAVVFRVWEMATDPDFENIILQYNQNEVDYTFNDEGTYYMRYRVANSDGSCEKTDDEIYTISLDPSSLGDETGRLPNVLSLGNGVWKVHHKSIIEFHCWIFNRWGNLVYEFTDPDGCWDGKSHGKYVDTGVYYCVVTATGSNGKKYKCRSDITVLNYKYGVAGGSTNGQGGGY